MRKTELHRLGVVGHRITRHADARQRPHGVQPSEGADASYLRDWNASLRKEFTFPQPWNLVPVSAPALGALPLLREATDVPKYQRLADVHQVPAGHGLHSGRERRPVLHTVQIGSANSFGQGLDQNLARSRLRCWDLGEVEATVAHYHCSHRHHPFVGCRSSRRVVITENGSDAHPLMSCPEMTLSCHFMTLRRKRCGVLRPSSHQERAKTKTASASRQQLTADSIT